MKVALLYPPPWKIAAAGEAQLPADQGGPPPGRETMALSGDFIGPPLGLLQLAAEALGAGHEVTTLNLSTFPWAEVEAIVAALDAELFGLSCFTANRRGAALVAEAIRRHHREAKILVGGPQVAALPVETLERWPAVDVVVLGEGEASFLELCQRQARGAPLAGVAGTAWREGAKIVIGPPRLQRSDLDELASIHDHFPTPFLLTSRGCPGRCAFCGSRAMWGGKVRRHSSKRVLDTMEALVRGQGLPLLSIKDDTFTSSRRRALEVCRGIEARGLRFHWLCDTRADSVDLPLVTAMRRAGCLQISLGVESGSPRILERLGKGLGLESIRRATRLARDFGVRVRWYLILGAPGETAETVEETFSLIREERPHQVVFSRLATYPGTRLARQAEATGLIGPGFFFDEPFWTPTVWQDVDGATRGHLEALLAELPGIARVCRPSLAECRAALARLPEVAANHMDLALALVEAGAFDEAEAAVEEALGRGHPLPAVGENARAVIASRRGDLEAALDHLEAASRGYPLRHVDENLARLAAWRAGDGSEALELDLWPHLEVAEELRQPMNPGPLKEEPIPTT